MEIDRSPEILVCSPPLIKAIKPFAPAKGYELHFNMETGVFSDHVPGRADLGRPGLLQTGHKMNMFYRKF